MAKFYGKVGYMKSIEKEPGIWINEIEERSYYGDVTRNSNRFQQSNNTTIDDIFINNVISIVADPYANENFQYMKYVEYVGTKWKITNAEVQYPRIILTLGGMYNERSERESEDEEF